MNELSLEKAKEIIAEPVNLDHVALGFCPSPGRQASMFKFTRLLMSSEVYHLDDIRSISKESHDLVHLSGVHKFRYEPPTTKAAELRYFWGLLWSDGRAFNQYPDLRKYIVDVCETSAFKGGWAKRPMGLFLTNGLRQHNYPWRTPEWYADRQPPKIPYQNLTEFYPFISTTPNEDHELLLAVDALVPKGLNSNTRADVCQDMIVAILSGEATLENIAGQRPKYMKQFFKMFPTKYGHLSLDAPLMLNGESPTTLGDMVAAEYR